MTDRITKEQRSHIMSSIKSNSRLENELSRALWKKGIRFRKNVKSLYGTPDIAIKKYKIVIFVDSCFWHCCPIHGNKPKSNVEFWEKKLNRNRERDQEVNEYYKDKGWTVIRIWEHEIRDDLDNVICNLVEE
jgi:DNA mismatch endonuclease, patch repair protein